MPSVTYKIFLDNYKWYYICTADPKGLSKRQISEIKALTDIVVKTIAVLNDHEHETDKQFMGGIFDESDKKQK